MILMWLTPIISVGICLVKQRPHARIRCMIAAIDIGGTKTLIVVFDASGKKVEEVKFPTPPDYENFKIELAKTVANLSTKSFSRVVVAAPGRIDRITGVVSAFGTLSWANTPLRADLAVVFQQRVLLENDANLAALSEGRLLYPTYHNALYITISTGIGAGLVIEGNLDPHFLDTEPGQMLFEHEGTLTDWEDFASGRAFQEKFGHSVSDTPTDKTEAWQWFAQNLAIGLVNLSTVLTPDVIIMGGGAGGQLDLFRTPLFEKLEACRNPMFTIPPIVLAKRAHEAVIYGCYDYAQNQ